MNLDDDMGAGEMPGAMESAEEEENYEGLHMSLHRSYEKIAFYLVKKMSVCREKKEIFIQMHFAKNPMEDVRNAYSEYEVAYLNTLQHTQLVIDKLKEIIKKKMADNDTLSSHMKKAVEMWSQFTATVHGKYNLLEDFAELGEDLHKFLGGQKLCDVIEQNVITCITDVRYCVVNHEDNEHERVNADFQLLHSDSLFKCTSNVEEIVYAQYLINEIIQLMEKPDMSPADDIATIAPTDAELTTIIRAHIHESAAMCEEIKKQAPWQINEFITHMPTQLQPINYITQLVAFASMLVEQAALAHMATADKTDKTEHMKTQFHAACERYLHCIWNRSVVKEYQDAEFNIMPDFIRDHNITTPLCTIMRTAIDREKATISKQLEKDSSEWCFEMFFEIKAAVAKDPGDKTTQDGGRKTKRRQDADPKHHLMDDSRQPKAMLRIVREMIRHNVLPNVKKSKYTRVGGG